MKGTITKSLQGTREVTCKLFNVTVFHGLDVEYLFKFFKYLFYTYGNLYFLIVLFCNNKNCWFEHLFIIA